MSRWVDEGGGGQQGGANENRTSHVADAWGAVEQMLAEGEPRDEGRVMQTATTLIAKLLGDRGACVLVDQGSARVAFATDTPEVAGRQLDLARYPEIAEALERHEVVCIDDARVDPRLANVRALLPGDLGRVVVLPLGGPGKLRGAIVVRAPEAGPCDRDALRAASAVAVIAGRLVAAVAPRPGRRPSAHQVVAPAVPGADDVGRRILIVEDDEDCRLSLQDLLVKDGYEVQLAADGQAALRTARQFRPDLVLLDVKMPGLSGFDVARRLKQDRRTRFASVIFLSGVEDLPRAILEAELEEADFLAKPFAVEALRARVGHGLRLAVEKANWRQQAFTDGLTGLGNVRLLEERLSVEASRIERYGLAFTVLLVDLDGLKAINDRHGHLVGSRVIQEVGQAIAQEARETDIAARYGGDEFVVLMPHTTLRQGAKLAERIHWRIRRIVACESPVTASVGVASYDRSADRTLENLMSRADAATYRAKRAGGDRIVIDEEGTGLARAPGKPADPSDTDALALPGRPI
jgi:diguanylate cyclase (GGDEF)-like protein